MYKKQGEELKQLRKSLKCTLNKVCKELRITPNYLSLIERGKRKPSESIMYDMAEFYHLNPVEIFSLYGTIPKEEIEKFISYQSLIKILSILNSEVELTKEEKNVISNLIEQEILKILEKRR